MTSVDGVGRPRISTTQVEGDKWEMYIPSELGYGDSGSPPKIPGGAPLVFQMEILNINGPTVPADKVRPRDEEGLLRARSFLRRQAGVQVQGRPRQGAQAAPEHEDGRHEARARGLGQQAQEDPREDGAVIYLKQTVTQRRGTTLDPRPVGQVALAGRRRDRYRFGVGARAAGAARFERVCVRATRSCASRYRSKDRTGSQRAGKSTYSTPDPFT